jgi:2-C-methyl-D-erythritol 4-phosphate cytidylyltransferase
MGSDKIFAEIHGKPVLLYTLEAFQKAESIDEIVVVRKHSPRVVKLCEKHGITKLSAVVPGGVTRTSSVGKGVRAIAAKSSIVAIHDGARPLITPELIDEVVEAAKKYNAAILAVPLKDTLKISRGGFIESTPNREEIHFAQTPQAFNVKMYCAAFDYARMCRFDGTDDCSLVGHFGINSKIVMGDYKNIKITTPEDLKIAEVLIGTD